MQRSHGREADDIADATAYAPAQSGSARELPQGLLARSQARDPDPAREVRLGVRTHSVEAQTPTTAILRSISVAYLVGAQGLEPWTR